MHIQPDAWWWAVAGAGLGILWSIQAALYRIARAVEAANDIARKER
ncbi:MAG: hypothetical protein JWM87_777 [Candidatus Eremiobacteraeota bacterium]|nr:hypothetical protein [Candidatus Eremiobacteraeota bacterium]